VVAYNQTMDRLNVTRGSTPLRNGQHTFLVSLVRHQNAHALDKAAVAVKTNEVAAVSILLAGRDLTGTITTMDALLTQRYLAQQILDQAGHYLMIIKRNQPTLYWAAQLVFDEPPATTPAR